MTAETQDSRSKIPRNGEPDWEHSLADAIATLENAVRLCRGGLESQSLETAIGLVRYLQGRREDPK